MLERSTLAGVPVLKRLKGSPNRSSDSQSAFAGNIPSGPLSKFTSPTYILPFRYVPVAMTTAPTSYSAPSLVMQCHLSPTGITSVISACLRQRFCCSSKACFIYDAYALRSICARKECTAGPLPRLSMRFCIVFLSAAFAISPPSASISRTR